MDYFEREEREKGPSKEVCTTPGNISVLQKAQENEVGLFLTPPKTAVTA